MQQPPHYPHHQNHLPNVLRHGALAGDVPLQFAFQAVRVVLLAAAALHLMDYHPLLQDVPHDYHSNHLPLFLVHLILDLVSGGDSETSCARDHVTLLEEPQSVVKTLGDNHDDRW